MSSFSSAAGDGESNQGSRNASLSASSQASSTDARRTSRLSSTAGIFDLDDDGSIDGASIGSGGGSRRASNVHAHAHARVSSLGSTSNRGSVAERGSRELFDVQEEDANLSSVPPAPRSASTSGSKGGAQSQHRLLRHGKQKRVQFTDCCAWLGACATVRRTFVKSQITDRV